MGMSWLRVSLVASCIDLMGTGAGSCPTSLIASPSTKRLVVGLEVIL